jgi:hypothetical protein
MKSLMTYAPLTRLVAVLVAGIVLLGGTEALNAEGHGGGSHTKRRDAKPIGNPYKIHKPGDSRLGKLGDADGRKHKDRDGHKHKDRDGHRHRCKDGHWYKCNDARKYNDKDGRRRKLVDTP